MLQLNFDDPYVAVALLAIIIGLRLAVYVAEHLQRDRTALAAPLAPDDAAEIPLPTQQAKAHDADSGFYRVSVEILDAAIIAVILVFCLVRPFIMQAFFIPSSTAWCPPCAPGINCWQQNILFTCGNHDWATSSSSAPPICLELIPPPQDQMQDQVDYVKRVIGVPGDRIRIEDEIGVFVNGHLLNEPYVAATPNYDFPTDSEGNLQLSHASHPGVAQLFLPYIQGKVFVVPPGKLFVMGDNRRESFDSHDWGVALFTKSVDRQSLLHLLAPRSCRLHPLTVP